jgi:hypothetical protein
MRWSLATSLPLTKSLALCVMMTRWQRKRPRQWQGQGQGQGQGQKKAPDLQTEQRVNASPSETHCSCAYGGRERMWPSRVRCDAWRVCGGGCFFSCLFGWLESSRNLPRVANAPHPETSTNSLSPLSEFTLLVDEDTGWSCQSVCQLHVSKGEWRARLHTHAAARSTPQQPRRAVHNRYTATVTSKHSQLGQQQTRHLFTLHPHNNKHTSAHTRPHTWTTPTDSRRG